MEFKTTLGLLAIALLPSCFAPAIDGTARYTQLSPDGTLAISDAAIFTSNSLSELGLDDKEGVPGAQVDFQWLGPHISVSTQSGSWSGTGVMSGEFSDGTNTIPIGANVDSELDLGIHSAIITWDFLPGDAELGLGFGVDLLDMEGSFTDQGTLQVIDFDESLPIPMLAIRANVHVGSIELGGHLAGFEIDYDGDEAQFIDLDVMGRYHFIGGDTRASGSLVLGFRSITLDVDYEGDGAERVIADLDFTGPYIGGQLSF
ncbi:MAG: hypothetical protein P1V35_09550 [Planctomycetota bacterium]|nr:hypothetical protein [Planctomycetota bacterium]